jgi:hypothetical protein
LDRGIDLVGYLWPYWRPMADLVGTKEVAELLGWSLAKVKREAKNGGLAYAHKGEGTAGYLFARSYIERKAKQEQAA